jgi:hypothetical protein
MAVTVVVLPDEGSALNLCKGGQARLSRPTRMRVRLDANHAMSCACGIKRALSIGFKLDITTLARRRQSLNLAGDCIDRSIVLFALVLGVRRV